MSLGRWLAVMLVRTPRAIAQRFADRKLRRLLRDAKPYSLAEMPEDTLGRVTGVVRPLDKRMLEAPLSGRLCVYYDVTVEPLHAGGTSLRVLASEHDAIPFVLEADGHRAVIDPAHAQISAGVDCIISSDALSPRAMAILDRHRFSARKVYFADGVMLREAILEADEEITVVGAGVREADPDAVGGGALYRDGGQTRLRLTGAAKFPLLISDDPRSLT
jgi:hypothetical protein